MGTRMVTWLASAVLLAACGGGAASETREPTAAAAPVGGAAAAPVAEETGGVARQGERCDYGGAERTTCVGGLECCYGEHETPDGYGTCQPECNWD